MSGLHATLHEAVLHAFECSGVDRVGGPSGRAVMVGDEQWNVGYSPSGTYFASNGLGGTVVWLHEPDAGRTFYYAHLDRQAFTEPRRVVTGDVLGYVGNTGNARTTAPHLHFGLYDDGPRDPLPYVQPDDVVPPLPRLPTLATR